MSNVWVAFVGRFASKKEMGEKFVLYLEGELGYEIIITKLEEVWGSLLRGGSNRYKEGYWIGLLEEKEVLLFLVCCASSTLRPECNNNVQHLYIPQDINLYIVGFQSRTLSLINDGVLEGVNNHYWEGSISVVRIS
jgi:hypothetical protein